MQTISDVFGIWDCLADMAREIGHPYDNVAKWKQRSAIPSHAWRDVIRAAAVRSRVVTPAELLFLNPPRKPRKAPRKRRSKTAR